MILHLVLLLNSMVHFRSSTMDPNTLPDDFWVATTALREFARTHPESANMSQAINDMKEFCLHLANNTPLSASYYDSLDPEDENSQVPPTAPSTASIQIACNLLYRLTTEVEDRVSCYQHLDIILTHATLLILMSPASVNLQAV